MKTNLSIVDQEKGSLHPKSVMRGFLTAMLLFAALFTYSHTPANTDTPGSSSEKALKKSIKFPAILAAQQQMALGSSTVEILFTTNGTGVVNFVLIKTLNEELRRDIEKQFYGLYLPQLKQNVVHSVVLNFKTL